MTGKEGASTTVSVTQLLDGINKSNETLYDKLEKLFGSKVAKEAEEGRTDAAAELLKRLHRLPNGKRFAEALAFGGHRSVHQIMQEDKERALASGAGEKAACLARALLIAKLDHGGDINKVPTIMADTLKQPDLADLATRSLTTVTKSLTTADPSLGGFWAQEGWADDFIPVLYANCIMGELGVPPYPMDEELVHIPAMSASTQVYWVGEGQAVLPFDPQAGERQLRAKTIAGLLIISSKLLRSASPVANQRVRDDLIKMLKLGVDKAFFLGNGSNFSPKGLANVQGVQGPVNFDARVDGDTMLTLLELLWRANVPMLRPGVAFNSAVKRDFMRLKTANGEWLYKFEMLRDGKLEGCRYGMSTQLPIGTDSYNTSDIFAGDYSEAFYGDRGALGMWMDTSNQAAYQVIMQDGSIQTRSLMQNMETGIIAAYSTDFNFRHTPSFVHGTVYTANA